MIRQLPLAIYSAFPKNYIPHSQGLHVTNQFPYSENTKDIIMKSRISVLKEVSCLQLLQASNMNSVINANKLRV